jgi:hypothetical protein
MYKSKEEEERGCKVDELYSSSKKELELSRQAGSLVYFFKGFVSRR